MTRTRHHVVSAGYLRFFADGEQLRLISKAARLPLPKLVGVKDAFVRKHFNSVWNESGEMFDDLEAEWARLESMVLPTIRHVDVASVDADADVAIKTLMAMHFARSYVVREMHDRITEKTLKEYAARSADDQELLRLFEIDRGRPPEPGEIDDLARATWATRHDSNEPFVQTMVKAHNFALERFRLYQLQFAVPGHRRLHLATGDSPLVYARGGTPQLGPLHGLALGDADALYMALRPDLGVSLTKSGPAQLELTGTGILELNNLIWRNSQFQVACHPADDWKALFNL